MKKIHMVLVAALALVLCVMFYNGVKPMPKGTNVTGEIYSIPQNSVVFLQDITFRDSSGKRVIKQEIFDEIFSMIDEAEKAVIIDIFLFNSFQGPVPEEHRKLCAQLAAALIKKKLKKPDIFIAVTSDEINTQYGGIRSAEFDEMKKAGIIVTLTKTEKLRDSVWFYPAFWRTFLAWAGNSTEGGFIPDPLSGGKKKITLRSYLKMLNLKANHRKLIIADAPGNKISLLVTSNNASDASSAHGNFAVRINDSVWKDALKSEEGIAEFSGNKFTAPISSADDKTGPVKAQFLSEAAIKKELLRRIKASEKGDSIDIIMFYFSHQQIMKELAAAAKRGVMVRMILDPNKDSFGRKRDGTPNRPMAHELYERSGRQAMIRWYDTSGEQQHGKMFVFTGKNGYAMVQGSCNMTRRNIDNLNLEADVMIESENKIPLFKKAEDTFEMMWNNEGGNSYTVDFGVFEEKSAWMGFKYRFMEMTGFCSF